MKTKVILTSFALAAATGSMFVACNNEDFVTENSGSIEQSGMIELSENFMISAAGVDNASTRTHWQVNQVNGKDVLTNVYIPVVAAAGTGNNTLGETAVTAPSIGLCWIGNAGAGEQVYTNYEFFHNGWLAVDETAKFNPCNEAELTNGWLYSDLAFAADYTVPGGGEEAFATVDNLKEVVSGKVNKDGKSLTLNDLDLNSGVYKTCNKAIFGGQYIAYYPYNKNFKDAGAIPATSVVEFKEMGVNNEKDLQLSDNTFRYSNVAEITGGQQAQGFGFTNLSGVVRIVLKGATDLDNKITKVMLYSKSGSFVKEVLLSPAKIAAGATGTELYSKVVSTSKTILVNMDDAAELRVTKTGGDYSKVYLTALPAKISDLVVMVQDANEEWAECEIGNFEIVAGEGRELVATYAASDFKKVYYAVDQKTLADAIATCESDSELSSTKKATIEVLGDITLSDNVTVPANVIIEGDKVIVPEGFTLTLEDNSAIKSEVEVQGESCCSDKNVGGTMIVKGATIDGNVTVLAGENADVADGSIVFAATDTKTVVNSVIETISDVDFKDDSNVEIFGTLTLGENATAKVYAKSVAAVKGGVINNNGTFEVLGDFSMLDAQGSTVASAGNNFFNNGTFIDNVGAKVGGATQYMTFGVNGDYICKVDSEDRMNEAYENKTACSTIDIIGGTTYEFPIVRTHKIRGVEEDVDIIVSNTNVIFYPKTAAIKIGNLTVKSAGDLTINSTESLGGNRYATITVDGNIKADGELTLSDDVLDFTVNGDITVAADFTVGKDVARMTANNLTVTKGVTTFANRVKSLDKTLEVSNTIEVKKGATFTITAKEGSNNIAYVTCTKLVEGGTFNGKPNVVE